MRHEQACGRYLLLKILLSLSVICLITAVFHHLMNIGLPIGTMCCHTVDIMLTNVTVPWLSLVARGVATAALLLSISQLLWRLWLTYRFVSHLKQATIGAIPQQLAPLCARLNLTEQTVVLDTPTPLAFCFGLLNPRIYLSTGLIEGLADKELRAVVLHEDHHRRRYDPLRTLLVEILATILFFLPVAGEWRDQFLTSVELAADRYAIRTGGRPALAGAMHKLLTHPLAIRLPAGSGLNGLNATNVRLAYLLDEVTFNWRFSTRSLLYSSLMLSLGCMVLQVSLF